MNRPLLRPRQLGVLLVGLFASLASAQSLGAGESAPFLPGRPEHGLPGAQPGTERWLVHFSTRSFDLHEFRAAVISRRPAAVGAAIIAEYELRVQRDQQSFVASVQALGGSVVQQWWIVNAAAVEIPPAQLPALRRLPGIAMLQPDETCEPAIGVATGFGNHDADSIQAQGHLGAGVAVGILDSGQDESMAGTGRPHRLYYPGGNPNNTTGGGIGGSRLLVNRQIGLMPADDGSYLGHGTAVASVAAGAGWSAPSADVGHAPAAGICGYSLAINFTGSTNLTVMTSGWQRLAADRLAFGIVSANMSYHGQPDPRDLSQQAIDAVAWNADVVCCISAGNTGASTATSSGATNAIAVGALVADTHQVASFSAQGPLMGDPLRTFPDLAACGVGMVMAARDNESGQQVLDGTSFAAPHVAGAATQLRARFPALSALECKAVLMGSSLDVASTNPGAGRNQFGVGMLRNDRAHALVAAGTFGSGSVMPTAPVTVQLPVVAGQTYQAAIAWPRLDTTSFAWSNLDLTVTGPGGLLATSNTPRNLYEFVRFQATATGMATIRIDAASVTGGPTQPFAWAVTEVPAVFGRAIAFGASCGPLGSSLNAMGGTLRGQVLGAEVAYDLLAPQTLALVAVDVWLHGLTPGVFAPVSIHGSAAGTIAPQPMWSGRIPLGTTPGFHRVTFSTPLTVPAGPFWFVIDHGSLSIPLCDLTSGTATGYYERTTRGSGPWTRAAAQIRPAILVYSQTPGGVGMPRMTATGGPRLGQPLGIGLAGALPGGVSLFTMGLSASAWSGGVLPYALTPHGAPGCMVWTSADGLLVRLLDAAGADNFTFAVPNNPALTNVILNAQYFSLHPGANSLGLLATSALQLTIGN